MMKFMWDERKDAANRQKHGISFDEARSVFFDEHARLIIDPDHSDDEDRFIILGYSGQSRLLVVCHCYRESDTINSFHPETPEEILSVSDSEGRDFLSWQGNQGIARRRTTVRRTSMTAD